MENAVLGDNASSEVVKNADEGDQSAKNDVLDPLKVENAIKDTLKVLSDANLTVAESIQVVLSLESAFRAIYPSVFGVLSDVKAGMGGLSDKVAVKVDPLD